MSEWFISEQGNPEDGYIWDLMKKDGDRAILVGQFFDEKMAEELMEAAKWRDAFLSGMVSLAMDGVVIDANTGKAWQRPKGLKDWDIQFEPPPVKRRTMRKPRT